MENWRGTEGEYRGGVVKLSYPGWFRNCGGQSLALVGRHDVEPGEEALGLVQAALEGVQAPLLLLRTGAQQDLVHFGPPLEKIMSFINKQPRNI